MVIDHSIAALLADARVDMVHVAVAKDADDAEPGSTLGQGLADRIAVHRCGGESRSMSVLAAARIAMESGASWLAVHDSVRPCLHVEDLRSLLDAVEDSLEPALLATRLPDTLKQGRDGRAEATVSREGKFLAQTPQVAGAKDLVEALSACADVTDESEALERLGHHPLIVEARHPNPKLTYPQDLQVVSALLGDGHGSLA